MLLRGRFEGFSVSVRNALTYEDLDEAGVLALAEELKREGLPINGCAVVTVNAETSGLRGSLQELLAQLNEAEGVLRGEILAG